MVKKIIDKHKIHWSRKEFIISTILGFLMLGVSFVINYTAGNFAAEKASNGVTDIILDNVPVMNVGQIFVWGAVFLFLFIVAILLYEPRYLPFTLKSLALFIFIRAVFVTLTHIGPYHDMITLPFNRFVEKITFGGDLFFSGHTGIPFLMALIFWKNSYLRYIFISLSIIFGISVLLGHLHYSIDVLSAFFITYTIFEMSKKFFPKSYSIIE